REPSGFAEVSILLDNSKKIFQIDFPTVKITRRIYPDLTNEYFINNSRVLRRDVEKLLLDTGIGKVSYSIMEQGRVEAILNSKPEERRAIFDEAAGISRYKLDKLETEKKLEQTNQNLLRINDIMLTMQRELEIKEKQAEKAKVYFQLKNELSEVDKNLRFLKLKALKSKQKKLETELAEVKEKNEQILSKMSADARRVEELEKERLLQEQKIAEIDKQLFDFLSQKELLREKIENNKKLILDYELRIEEQNDLLNSETTKVLSMENNLQIIEDSILQTKENIQLSEGTILSFIKKRTELEKELDNLVKEISECETEISQNDKLHNEFREQVKELVVSIINQIEAKKLESESSESKRVELKNYLLQSLDEFIQITENIQNSVYDINVVQSEIQKLTLREFREKLREFLDIEDIFRDILFDKEGMLAQKQNLDQKIEEIILRNDELTNKIRENNQKIQTIREAISQNKEEVYNLEKQILEWKTRLLSYEENKLSQKRQIEETNFRITQIQSTISTLNEKKYQLEEEMTLLQAKIEEYSNEFLSIGKILESEKQNLTNLQTEIQNLKLSQGKDQEEFKSLLPILSELERKCSGVKVQLDTFNEELYNEYSITDEELEKERANKNLKQDQEETRLREIKSEIQLLGSINPLAIEEYQQVKEIYEHHKTQREDIEKSKA
ncbi:MAG: chromosome partitioning protein ParA, partial [Leptospiraceae bacterium]|nr:chromosome partitioning protein ParA [Leptospiraceae bacterium]